jgi:hypothetical protein
VNISKCVIKGKNFCEIKTGLRRATDETEFSSGRS